MNQNSETTRICVLILLNIPRRGISEPELNKHLEKAGLSRVRVRMQCVVRYVDRNPLILFLQETHLVTDLIKQICWYMAL
jgi:hypothetical protein